MLNIAMMKNQIQYYAWGSHSSLAELRGEDGPTAQPEAELWMGAHPKAPSKVIQNGEAVDLLSLIETDPLDTLGEDIVRRFGHELPFLFKVLAAETPLSIQAHPNLQQAHEGFERENQEGIPIGARERNYRDPHHKPELICALTPFWAMRGFREPLEIISLFRTLSPTLLFEPLHVLEQHPDEKGLKTLFRYLLTMDKQLQRELVESTVSLIDHQSPEVLEFEWVQKLHRHYPGDIGSLCPLLLNLICLQPGEAMFLPAGELHAYLLGTGIELMANSDNVLRGGLTPKHVDVPELLKTLTFTSGPIALTRPVKHSQTLCTYPTPFEEFVLGRIRLSNGVVHHEDEDHGVQLLLCTKGEALIRSASGLELRCPKGSSVFVPASAPAYQLAGTATLFRASVPVPTRCTP